MTEINVISEIVQVSTPVGLIIAGIWWLLAEGWPYWKQRDESNRQQHHLHDMAQVAAQKETASATKGFSDALVAFTRVLNEVCCQD